MNIIMGTSFTPELAALRPGDVKHSQADVTRISDLLKFRPVIVFEEELQETVVWLKQMLEPNTQTSHMQAKS